MFTGLVEEIGVIKTIRPRGDGAAITVQADKVLVGVQLGDSIALSGACQTVVSFERTSFTVEAVRETMNRTKFGKWTTGQVVNLERAMLPTSRMGGHMVQGHVDCVSEVVSVRQLSGSWRVGIAHMNEGRQFVVEKGSIALDGVSLTVASTDDKTFEVEVIPHTWANTTLNQWKPGEKVHIEYDIIAKYVANMLGAYTKNEGITMQKLAESGFLNR